MEEERKVGAVDEMKRSDVSVMERKTKEESRDECVVCNQKYQESGWIFTHE